MEGSARQRRAVSGAILAGGQALRFEGRDKTALVVGGRRIIDRQVDALRSIATEILVVGVPAGRYADLGVTAVPDLMPGTGPLGGLHTALVSAASPHVVVLACDLPLVDGRFLAHLVEAIGDADACVPRDDRGWHPLCACFATRCAAHLASRLEAGARKVIDAILGLSYVEVGPDDLRRFDRSGRMLTNVNTAADYAAVARSC